MQIKLRQQRKKRKVSQRQLAKNAGVSRSYISEIEAGIKENPGVDFL